MDLSKFKVLKEHPDGYDIGHPSGKSIHVKKSELSPKAKEAVQKLADGGSVLDPVPDPTADIPQSSSAGTPAGDQGTPPSDLVDNAGNPPVRVDGGGRSDDQIIADQNAALASAQTDQSGADRSPASTSLATADQPLLPPSKDNAMQTQINAMNAGANAEGKIGQAEAQAYQDYQKQMELMPTPEDIFKAHQYKDQELLNAYASNKIDPNHYWKNQDTGSKIASSIGLIFSGMGSATTGQPNYAMQNINNAIERDIDAQKNDQSKAMNLWKMNRENTQSEQEATLATQNQMLNAVKAKMMATQGQYAGTLAHARIAPEIAQINQQLAENNFRRALLTPSSSTALSNIDPAQIVPFLVKNPDQQKQVYEEIGRAQNVSKNSQSILDAFDQSAKDSTVVNTIGGVREPGSTMRLKQLLLPNFKQVDGTVRQAAMDETFANTIPSAWDGPDKIAQKKQALVNWMHSETAAPVAKGNGIDLQRFKSTSADPVTTMSPQQQQYYAWAKANPQDPRSAMVLKKLGVQ